MIDVTAHRRYGGDRRRTDAGDIEAEVVVNCAGSGPMRWAHGGVNVPLHSAEHFYVVTETIEGVHRTC